MDIQNILHSMSRPEEHSFEERKRKRPSQESNFEEEIAWTTARCNRLLRTINSRIEAIRQLLRPDIRVPEAARKPHTKSRKQKPESLTDPAWLPNGVKKPRTQTYAGSRKAKVSRPVGVMEANGNGKAQRITLPSPFLKRVQNFDSDRLPSSPLQTHDIPDQTRQRRSLKLPVRIEDPVRQAEVALFNAFYSFMKVTREPKPVSRRGASSLLRTCFRKMPEYVESQNEASSDDASYDSSDELWSFFDELLEIKGSNWQGLREVVRSQGLNAVRWAVFDGVLSDKCVGALVNYCTCEGALVEAEKLLVDWYQRSDAVSYVKIDSAARIATDRHAEGVRFRIWRQYIEQAPGRLSALVTAYGGLWNTILSGVTEGAQDEALEFLQACIESHAWNVSLSQTHDPRSDSITNNLNEVASKLFAMASTSLLINNGAYGQYLQEKVYQLAASLLLQEDVTAISIGATSILGHVVLTAITNEPHYGPDNHALLQAYNRAIRTTVDKRKSLKREQEFVALIAADLVSLYVDQGLPIADAVLVRIKEHIQQQHAHPATTALLRQIAIEILTRLRIENGRPDDGTDSNIDQYMPRETKLTDSLQTPRTKSPRFGWDANLCEWIAKTPFTKEEKKHALETPSFEALLCEGKENLEPETPDVLAKSVVKVDRPRIAFVQIDLAERSPLQSRSRTGSPQVIVARPVKRRKSDRLERKRSEVMQEDCGEDELAV